LALIAPLIARRALVPAFQTESTLGLGIVLVVLTDRATSAGSVFVCQRSKFASRAQSAEAAVLGCGILATWADAAPSPFGFRMVSAVVSNRAFHWAIWLGDTFGCSNPPTCPHTVFTLDALVEHTVVLELAYWAFPAIVGTNPALKVASCTGRTTATSGQVEPSDFTIEAFA
jgi:hypothetical protein